MEAMIRATAESADSLERKIHFTGVISIDSPDLQRVKEVVEAYPHLNNGKESIAAKVYPERQEFVFGKFNTRTGFWKPFPPLKFQLVFTIPPDMLKKLIEEAANKKSPSNG